MGLALGHWKLNKALFTSDCCVKGSCRWMGYYTGYCSGFWLLDFCFSFWLTCDVVHISSFALSISHEAVQKRIVLSLLWLFFTWTACDHIQRLENPSVFTFNEPSLAEAGMASSLLFIVCSLGHTWTTFLLCQSSILTFTFLWEQLTTRTPLSLSARKGCFCIWEQWFSLFFFLSHIWGWV